ADEGAVGVAGRFQEGGTDRLFAEELVHDALLDALHERLAEKAHDRGVDARGHEAEGVARRYEAIVRFEVFEPAMDHTQAGEAGKARKEGVVHGLFGMHEPEVAEHQFWVIVVPGGVEHGRWSLSRSQSKGTFSLYHVSHVEDH